MDIKLEDGDDETSADRDAGLRTLAKRKRESEVKHEKLDEDVEWKKIKLEGSTEGTRQVAILEDVPFLSTQDDGKRERKKRQKKRQMARRRQTYKLAGAHQRIYELQSSSPAPYTTSDSETALSYPVPTRIVQPQPPAPVYQHPYQPNQVYQQPYQPNRVYRHPYQSNQMHQQPSYTPSMPWCQYPLGINNQQISLPTAQQRPNYTQPPQAYIPPVYTGASNPYPIQPYAPYWIPTYQAPPMQYLTVQCPAPMAMQHQNAAFMPSQFQNQQYWYRTMQATPTGPAPTPNYMQ